MTSITTPNGYSLTDDILNKLDCLIENNVASECVKALTCILIDEIQMAGIKKPEVQNRIMHLADVIDLLISVENATIPNPE